MFRNGTGWKSTACAVSRVFSFKHHPVNWSKALSEAMCYYLMLKELERLNLHMNIRIGAVGALNLKKCSEYIQNEVSPMATPNASAIVLEGHSKVIIVPIKEQGLTLEDKTLR